MRRVTGMSVKGRRARRLGSWLVVLLLLIATLAACAQSEVRPIPIAILLTDEVRLAKCDGLKAGLAELGYPEDRLAFTIYSARGVRERLPELAAEALAAKPALIVAGGGIEAVTLHQSGNQSIPVVMMGVASTIRSGLVDSYARPGGMMTGLDNQHAELSAKRLELLTKLVPDLERVLLIYDPSVIPGAHALEVTEEAAARLGVQVSHLPVESLPQALAALGRMEHRAHDAALLLPTFRLETGVNMIASELERLGIPAMGPLDLGGEAGLLAAYGNSMEAQGRQAARFVAKILQGEHPGSIPVEIPDNPELVVNLSVVERLGVELLPEGMAFARIRSVDGEVAP